MIEPKREAPFEDELEIREFFGRNTFGDHNALKPGELRECINYEVYNDQLKSRLGSQFVSNGIDKCPAGDIKNVVSWDTGDNEYVIIQVENFLYYFNTTAPSVYTIIPKLGGGAFNLGNNARAELVVSGDRLYVFHNGGNKIVQWDGAAFKGRQMGLPAPRIDTLTSSIGGNLTGRYTYGVELCYFVDGAEITASTPNRIMYTTKKVATITCIDTDIDSIIQLTINPSVIVSDTLWTHLKVWRSFNQGVNTTDIDSNGNLVVDDQGQEDVLHLLAVISKTELTTVVVSPVSVEAPSEANSIIPAGNTYVQAGKVGGIYTITDNATDDFLQVIGETGVRSLDNHTIERQPIPACSYGAFHNKRIFASGVGGGVWTNTNDPIDDKSSNNVYYSPFNTSVYAETTDIFDFVDTSRDGQAVKRLISFEKDLIILKEAQTCRVPYGDPVKYPYEVMDTRIGISDPQFVQFVPELGICAITNNYQDFMIFGYDQTWRSSLNGLEISKSNRASTENYSSEKVSMVYANNKLFISKGSGAFDILNAGEKRGWSEFQYPMSNYSSLLVNFKNGKNIGVVGDNQFMIQLEVKNIDVDASWIDDSTDNIYDPYYITHQFQYKDGSWIIDARWISVMGSIVENMYGVPYVNGLPWANITSETITAFVPLASSIPLTQLKNREFKLYVEPADIGVFKWCFCIGNFIHYKITTTAPCNVGVHRMRGIFDEQGFNFDPFQDLIGDGSPPWFNDDGIIIETGTAPTVYVETGTAPITITE